MMANLNNDGLAAGGYPTRGRKRVASRLAALAAVALSLAAVVPAEAANPPRVNPESCSRLKSQVGAKNVWQTSFVGQRQGPFDQMESTHAAPCFRTQDACKAWLYWAQTDWDRYQYFTPCKKGIR